MTLEEYQRASYKFAVYKDGIYPVLGLMEEVGELVTFFSKEKRGDYDTMDVALLISKMKDARKEVGDILWMLSAICTDLNWSMDEIAQENIGKLTDRQVREVIKGEGDNR